MCQALCLALRMQWRRGPTLQDLALDWKWHLNIQDTEGNMGDCHLIKDPRTFLFEKEVAFGSFCLLELDCQAPSDHHTCASPSLSSEKMELGTACH